MGPYLSIVNVYDKWHIFVLFPVFLFFNGNIKTKKNLIVSENLLSYSAIQKSVIHRDDINGNIHHLMSEYWENMERHHLKWGSRNGIEWIIDRVSWLIAITGRYGRHKNALILVVRMHICMYYHVYM